MTATVLFDAGHSGSSLLPFPMPLVLLGGAVIAVFGLLRPGRVRGDKIVGGARSVLFLIAILLVAVAALLPMAIGFWARRELARGQFEEFQGCVAKFNREVLANDHNISDTFFSLAGRDFHLTSNPWLPGFHNEENAIHAGDGLRIAVSGSSILRVEKDGRFCVR